MGESGHLTLRQSSPGQVEVAAPSRRLQQPGGNGRFGLVRPETCQTIHVICLFEARHGRCVDLAGSGCRCCCYLLRLFYFLPQKPTSGQRRSSAAALLPPAVFLRYNKAGPVIQFRCLYIAPFTKKVSLGDNYKNKKFPVFENYTFVIIFWRVKQS